MVQIRLAPFNDFRIDCGYVCRSGSIPGADRRATSARPSLIGHEAHVSANSHGSLFVSGRSVIGFRGAVKSISAQ